MSARRNRQRADSISKSDEGKKKKKEKSPEVLDIEQKQKLLRAAFSQHYRGRDTVVNLGPKAKITFPYENEKGQTITAKPMSKRDYNTLFTTLLDAQKDLVKAALAVGGKKASKQIKDRITIAELNPDYVDTFKRLIAEMPSFVRTAFNKLIDRSSIPVSKKLLANMVRFYVYKNKLYAGAGKQTEKGTDNKGQFRVDAFLSELMLFSPKDGPEEEVKVNDVIRQIQLASRLRHLIGVVPEAWEFPREKGDDDVFDETTRLDRYNEYSDKARGEWEKNREKEAEYPDTIELDAARDTLLDEGIKLAGKPANIVADRSLEAESPGLYMVASVDYVAELINSEIESFKK